MAAIWVLRLAIMVAPAVQRACSTNGCDAQQATNLLGRFWSRITDPDEDPVQLTADMSAAAPEGGAVAVTDYPAPFETRRLSVRFTRAPGGGRTEDVDVISVMFLKVVGGVPSDDWSGGTEYAAVESAFDTMFNGTYFKANWPTWLTVAEYRWHKDGPAWRPTSAHYNPAVRVTPKNIAGTGAAAAVSPPQCALSVTERTAERPNWGRFYLPGGMASSLATDGTWADSVIAGVLAGAVTCFNACRAAGAIPVVYAPALPARDKHKNGVVVGQLPARADMALEVLQLQVDEIVDIVRRRRWQTVLHRHTTALT